MWKPPDLFRLHFQNSVKLLISQFIEANFIDLFPHQSLTFLQGLKAISHVSISEPPFLGCSPVSFVSPAAGAPIFLSSQMHVYK